MTADHPLDIAIVGTGISGMAAAWLLARRHRVTVYEASGRPGGHSHTVMAPAPGGTVPVDTGFIVYNERNYPNLVRLFDRLGVETRPAEMTLGISLDDGRLEYGGADLTGLFAQKRNLVRPRFWAMLAGLRRFYREARLDLADLEGSLETLGDYLARRGYSSAFQEDHLLPMAAAIWSAPAATLRHYPAAAFLAFCDNHGLMQFTGRPVWRTVVGGSTAYVSRLTAPFRERIRLDCPVRRIRRAADHVLLDAGHGWARYDHVVLAGHADQSLALLTDPGAAETRLLGAFRYSRNRTVLHGDAAAMPRRRAVWSSWNYLGRSGADGIAALTVTYWMNRLQGLDRAPPLFVTLNPARELRPDAVIAEQVYEHPIFDPAAIRAQRELWSLQGRRRSWFCGAYFGAGFHEDGLQSGLAVAEALGGERRPWTVADESGRIHLSPLPAAAA